MTNKYYCRNSANSPINGGNFLKLAPKTSAYSLSQLSRPEASGHYTSWNDDDEETNKDHDTLLLGPGWTRMGQSPSPAAPPQPTEAPRTPKPGPAVAPRRPKGPHKRPRGPSKMQALTPQGHLAPQ